jgi:hypothetical protein
MDDDIGTKDDQIIALRDDIERLQRENDCLRAIKRLRAQSVTLPRELVHELWDTIKNLRDAIPAIRQWEEDLNALLERMEDAGMSDHLPTLEEVRAVWRGE